MAESRIPSHRFKILPRNEYWIQNGSSSFNSEQLMCHTIYMCMCILMRNLHTIQAHTMRNEKTIAFVDVCPTTQIYRFLKTRP